MFSGTVSKVETGGLWIDAANMISTMLDDLAWAPLIADRTQSSSLCTLFELAVFARFSGVSTQINLKTLASENPRSASIGGTLRPIGFHVACSLSLKRWNVQFSSS
jgi:hypothetical protein